MAFADPHCHTLASDGMVTAAQLVAAAAERGLAVIAVTDHDTMAATSEAVARGVEAGVGVIPGQEITTRLPAKTHVVGWFLRRPVRTGMSLVDTVDAIHDQGGLAVIVHPFMPTYFASCQPGMLRRLLDARPIDAIEVRHTAPMTRARQQALELFCRDNAERVGALIGASDCHFGAHDLGRSLTEFEGETADDFRAAVLDRATVPVAGREAHIPGRLVLRQQRRSLVELPVRRLLRRL